MKKFFFFVVIASFYFGSSFARIWRVNNVAGVSADFTTVQLAHDNIQVQAGDTLHLEPSAVSYGGLAMTKRLTIISTGDFFGSNPTVQYSRLAAHMTSISINDVNANGSVLQCNCTAAVTLSGVSNIRIERCHLESTLTLTYSTSITVLNNFLNYLSVNIGSSAVLVSNNIFETYVDMAPASSATISNNVFKATSANGNQVA